MNIKIMLISLFCTTQINTGALKDVEDFFYKQEPYRLFKISRAMIKFNDQDVFPKCSICKNTLIEGQLYKLPKQESDCGQVFHYKCLNNEVFNILTCPLDLILGRGIPDDFIINAIEKDKWEIFVSVEGKIRMIRLPKKVAKKRIVQV